jgi:hypothetical protein
LKKFFKILQGANTQALEVLFANNYISKTEVGEKVLANRDLFLSKNYCRSIRGFALSELRKAKAVNLVMKYEDKDSESVFTKLFGKYNLTRLEINSIMDIVFSEREGDPRKEEPSTLNLEAVNTITPDLVPDICGVFRSKKQAKDFISKIAKEYQLCEKLLGIDTTSASCFSHKLGICKGACVGKEKPLAYNIRFIEAISAPLCPQRLQTLQ